MADIKIDSTDSTKINLEVADSNDLNLKLTGGDKGLRLHVLETIYPIGSIYTNAGVATNPGTLLGFGTWSAFGSGRVIVGVDSTDTDFDAVRETGGAKTHTLTVAQLAAHTHNVTMSTSDSDNDNLSEGNTSGTSLHPTSSTGGGEAHNNLQPYITAYMWRRTA